MLFLFPRTICAFLLLTFTAQSLDVSMKGDGCSTFDRCTIKDIFRTCSCEADCHLYGTCCVDAENFPSMETSPREFSCHSSRTKTPVFIKTSCSSEFKAHEGMIAACQDPHRDLGDMMDNLLISSSKTRTTYANKNCALCNKEDEKDLQYWTVEVSCPSKHEDVEYNQRYIRKHLTFNESSTEWGLTTENEFVPCSFLLYQPNYMVGKLKYCAPNMISNCPNEFVDKEVVGKCDYYYGERKQKSSNLYFKNVHCAVCNGIGLKDLDCVGRNYEPVELNFGTDVLKVVFPDGEWIEKEGKEKFKCSENFSYDPFQKRCRRFLTKTQEPFAASSACVLYGQICVLVASLFIIFNKLH